jgi:hypothetical protein
VRIRGVRQGVDLEADALELVRRAENDAGPSVGPVAPR